MQSCFHLDLSLKLKGINIAMGGEGERALRLLFRFGNRVLGGRGEVSTECLNLFATACMRTVWSGNSLKGRLRKGLCSVDASITSTKTIR